jgi:hypothetical protein
VRRIGLDQGKSDLVEHRGDDFITEHPR